MIWAWAGAVALNSETVINGIRMYLAAEAKKKADLEVKKSDRASDRAAKQLSGLRSAAAQAWAKAPAPPDGVCDTGTMATSLGSLDSVSLRAVSRFMYYYLNRTEEDTHELKLPRIGVSTADKLRTVQEFVVGLLEKAGAPCPVVGEDGG